MYNLTENVPILYEGDDEKIYIEGEKVDEEEEGENEEFSEKQPKETVKRVEERKNTASFNILFLKRFFRLVWYRSGINSYFQPFLVLLALFFSVLNALASYWLTLNYSHSLNSLSKKDYNSTWKYVINLFLFSLLQGFCEFMVLNGVILVTLSVLWRKNITKYVLDRYFKGKNYYVVLNLKNNSVDNPDQRLQSDIKDFSYNLAVVLIHGIRGLSQVGVNFYIIIKLEFYWLLIPIFVIPTLCSLVYFILFIPTSRAVFNKDSNEGDFRFSHSRIREYAESMAFFKSDETEKSNVNFLFKRVVKSLTRLAIWMFFVTFFTQVSYWVPNIVYIAIVIVLFFSNSPPFHSNITGKETLDLITMSIHSGQSFTQNFATTMGLAQNFGIVIGNTARISELLEAIDENEKNEKIEKKSGRVLDHPEAIHLEGITIRTPKNKVLIKDLNIKVTQGEHVIIMGESGSGKSSIIRVIGGLWNFQEGTLARPRNFGPGGMFFLPQKPYLVRGSLKDNIVYPSIDGDYDLSDSELVRVMKFAKIEHLLLRASLHEEDVFWEEKLSLGEQQRLSFARAFFHRPRFVLLDESTSALDPENEQILYHQLAKSGITMISVAHRKSVMKFHKWLLHVDNGQDYELRKIEEEDLPKYDVEWEQLEKHIVKEEERDDFELSKNDIEWREGSLGKTGLNITFLRRIFKLFCFCVMIRKWWEFAFVIFAFLFSAFFALSPMLLIVVNGKIMGATLDRNLQHVILYGSFCAAGFIFIAFGTGCASLLFMLQGICCRMNLTKYVHKLYFRNRMFYEMNILDKRVDNCDQRICSDIDLLTSGFAVSPGLSYMEQLLVNSAVVIFAMFVWGCFVSYLIPVYTIVTMIVAGAIQLVFVIFLSKLRFLQQRREGYFRNSLTRMKEYSEQIALLNGKKREKQVISKFLSRALTNQWLLGIVAAGSGAFGKFVDFIGVPLAVAVVILSIYIKIFSVDNITEGAILALVTTNISMMANLNFVFLGVLTSLLWIGQSIGTIGRVGQLIEQMQFIELRKKIEEKKQLENKEERRIQTFDWIGVKNLTAQTPTFKKLFYNLTFQMEMGLNTIVVGPSGCGKSSLLRIIGGLWDVKIGKVYCPDIAYEGKFGKKYNLFFLPQRPYLILGTLKEQIIYPDTASKETDENLLEVLEKVNLGYIYERVGGWESVEEWSSILSPGEQQRIGMARLVYHRPKFCILDESTSSLDEINEELMYNVCLDNEITFLSIGHRKSILRHHSRLLKFDGNGGWEFCRRKEEEILGSKKKKRKNSEKSDEIGILKQSIDDVNMKNMEEIRSEVISIDEDSDDYVV